MLQPDLPARTPLAHASGPAASREIPLERQVSELAALVERARSFDAGGDPIFQGKFVTNPEKAPLGQRMIIEAYVNRENRLWWAVKDSLGNAISRDLCPTIEPQPSSRTDEYFAAHRFATSAEAFAIADAYRAFFRAQCESEGSTAKTHTWPESN